MSHFDRAVDTKAHDEEGSTVAEGPSTTTLDLSHDKVGDLLSDYVSGSLPEAERESVEAHLRQCRSCRALANTFKQTVDLAHQLPPKRAPEGLKQQIREQLKSVLVRG